MSVLAKVKALFFQHREAGENGNEGTAFPFWYVAVNGGGLLRRPVMVSKGIWFSRKAAEEHLEAKRYRYAKTAFVYCDSGHDSWTGLRALYGLLEAEGIDDTVALEEMIGLARQLAEFVDNPNDSLKFTILDRYEGSAKTYVERTVAVIKGEA